MSAVATVPGNIAFFCRPARSSCGYPIRAQACRCDDDEFIADVADVELCAHCGHFTAEAIDRTWETQARHMAFNVRGMLARAA